MSDYNYIAIPLRENGTEYPGTIGMLTGTYKSTRTAERYLTLKARYYQEQFPPDTITHVPTVWNVYTRYNFTSTNRPPTFTLRIPR